MVRLATPLPTSPTRGEVPFGECGTRCASGTPFTSPLVGEDGRGEAPRELSR